MRKKGTIVCFCLATVVIGIVLYGSTIGFHRVRHIAGSMPLRDKVDLMGMADTIIKGKVEELLPSKWSNPFSQKGTHVRNILQTDIRISVLDVFKGKPYSNESVLVRVDEGEKGNYAVENDDFPDFAEGEEVILFLAKDDSDVADPNEYYYVLVGAGQGKFRHNKDSVDQDEFVMDFAGRDEKIKGSSLKEEIEKSMEAYAQRPKMTKEEIRKNNEELFGK